MSLNILEAESNYEDVTYIGYSFRVRKYVYPYFLQKNYDLLTLFGNDAIREKFSSYCFLPDVVYISGFGHGYDNLFTGQHGEVLWKVGSYDPREAQGKIIHLMSCLTARRLGPDLVDKGARAYFGYEEEFTFIHTIGITDPLEDPIADVFFECNSQVDRLIADGLSAGRVYDATKELFREKYEDFLARDSDVAMTLLHDHDCFRIYGDQEASLPTDVTKELKLNTSVSGNLSKTGDSRDFVLKGVKQGEKLTFTLNGPDDGDFDLYVRINQEPELRKFDYRGYTESSNEEITIEPTQEGDYYVRVHSYHGMGPFTIKASVPMAPEGEEIELEKLIIGTLGSKDDSKKYVVKDVDGGEELFVTLDGPEGADFDIYVKSGSPATLDDYDIRGYTGLPDENVVIYPTVEGDYYITVHSYRGSGEYKLRASL
ncbi:hypothetical protein C6A37_01090 [Desulfobacteraceae bacterium SEEP-SAG9]|nr:hypothetical protein C6A37_01090 [Desulfobacteraceae bacterium SEEP-SAG9]